MGYPKPVFTLLLLFVSVYSNAAPTTLLTEPAYRLCDTTRTDSFLVTLLKGQSPITDSVLKNRKLNNVQVIYTQIDRGGNGMPGFKQYYLNVDTAHYFYPVTSVQLPVAMLTLQKLAALKNTGIDKYSAMLTGVAYSGQTAAFNDPASTDGSPSLAQYLKRMLLAGDEEAYNRLYEFLGQQYINQQLQIKGYTSAQLTQRYDTTLTGDENRHTNPLTFLNLDGKEIYKQSAQNNTLVFAERKDSLGKAFFRKGILVRKPMDFSGMNRLSLEDAHQQLISLIFPGKVTAAQRFGLSGEDRKFMLKYMSQWPAECDYPPYADDSTCYPAYRKYIYYGAGRGSINDSIRIFNISGKGYGHLLDMAYVVDFEKQVEFILSAVVYCNSDGVLNDTQDDYDTIGLRFMKELGRIIYNYETKRNKRLLPDLSEWRLRYDKKPLAELTSDSPK